MILNKLSDSVIAKKIEIINNTITDSRARKRGGAMTLLRF